MKKRIMCLFLCFVMLFNVLHLDNVQAAGHGEVEAIEKTQTEMMEVSVKYEDETVSELTVLQDEKKTLTAECTIDDSGYSYQWQILADINSDSWADIYEATESSLEISYALVAEVLDNADGAYIRCTVDNGTKSVYSQIVCIMIVSNPKSFAAYDSQLALETVADEPTDSEADRVVITVNYLDSVTGDAIYSPHVAQIEKGTSYAQVITSPVFVGYAPYWNSNDHDVIIPENGEVDAPDTASVVTLNYSNVMENKVVNVYYKPVEVAYAIKYFFQNINDDWYTENPSLYYMGTAETGTIITDEELRSHAGATTGFTKLYHFPESVAADGSTVFECYYDRVYYLLKFDMDGGYGVDPIYARYDTPFIVNNPEKPGYVFQGWDLVSETVLADDGIYKTFDKTTDATKYEDGTADIIPSTIPANSQNYRAIWTKEKTKYTVVYWLEDARKDNQSDDAGATYSYLDRKEVNDVLSGSDAKWSDDLPITTEHYEHYVYDKEKTDEANEGVKVKGDGSTVVNVYYKRKEYTLRFFYARSSGTGEDIQYQVVGGSTYYFGMLNTNDNMTVTQLLKNVPDGEWGTVAEKPLVEDTDNTQEGIQTPYDLNTLTANGYTYHYLSFKAKYGDYIGDKWPIGIFEPVYLGEGAHNNHSAHNCDYDWGYFSAWNGERKVKYTQDHSENQTIKGCYMYLDEDILYASKYSEQYTEDTVSYLAFWEHVLSNKSWNLAKYYKYELYLQQLDGTYPATPDYTFDTYDDAEIKDQTASAVSGFEYEDRGSETMTGVENVTSATKVKFYYTRLNRNITFFNFNETLYTKSLPYDTPLADVEQEFTLHYPDELEDNAYEFAGWYSTPECYDNSKVDLATAAMPASDLMLYAKWTPKIHTVRFFQTYDAMLAYESTGSTDGLIDTETIAHGNVISSIDNPTDQSGNGYAFGGWFYMNAGVKTAYTPLDMPVKKSFNVFADWGSHTAQPYTIHYALQEKETNQEWLNLLSSGEAPKDNVRYKVTNGTETRGYVYLEADNGWHLCIADDTSGYAYQGSTRTFNAKAGEPYNQLYLEYNNGYYPLETSHSITLQHEPNKLVPQYNVFTFTYVYAAYISYTVKYLDKITNKEVAPDVTKTTTNAVVTERFKVVENKLPDAFYKRLIISVEKDANGDYVGSAENVITFYYSENKTAAYYAVHYMMQKIDSAEPPEYELEDDFISEDFEENDAHSEGIGTIGDTYQINPPTFTGFTPVLTTGYTVVGGKEPQKITNSKDYFEIKVEAEGTELYIFYNRNKYDYKVYHLEYGTDISDLSSLVYNPDDTSNGVLAPVETGKDAYYGSTVTASALKEDTVKGMKMSLVSAETQSIKIKANEEQNYIIFYYIPLQYTTEYKVVNEKGGTLSNTIEVVSARPNEGEKSAFEGSEPKAERGYAFKGWFLDKACTIPADEKADVDEEHRLTPKMDKLDAMPKTNTFYAKFEPLKLTITRTNSSDEGNENQVFVYKITHKTKGEVFYATITGNGSTTITKLPEGEYTVEQLNNWSWRYEDEAVNVTINEKMSPSVTFDGGASNDNWLNGNSALIRNRKGGSS